MINQRSHIQNGVWIQEVYEGSIEARKNAMTLTRKYILRKKGNNHRNRTQEMHQAEAYAALQAFILRHQYMIRYNTYEGAILIVFR